MSAEQSSMARFSVLVVDDDLTSLYVVASMLRTFNYEVVAMGSPIEALATCRIQDIDLVVTDLHMPEMSGLELQQRINKEYDLPVIIMSSDEEDTTILKTLASGAVFFLQKPVTPKDLKNVWQYAVQSKRGKSGLNLQSIRSLHGESPMVENNTPHSSSSSTDQANNSGKGKKQEKKKDAKTNSQKKYRKDTEKDGDDADANENTPKRPRIVWTDALHSQFLQAIRHITLEKAVPKKILAFMNAPELTRENVASHLQKYRLFLKIVAEKGFAAAAKKSLAMDKTFRSCFAAAHASMILESSQEPSSLYKRRSDTASATASQSFKLRNFGSIGTLSSRNSALPSSSRSFRRTNFSSISGLSRSNSALPSSSRSFKHTNVGSTSGLSSSNYALSWPPAFKPANDVGSISGPPSSNSASSLTKIGFGQFLLGASTYARRVHKPIRGSTNPIYKRNHTGFGLGSNDYGTNLLSPGVINGGSSVIGTHQQLSSNITSGTNDEELLSSTFGSFSAPAPAGFNAGDYQLPSSFSGVNEQASTSAVSSMAQQQPGLGGNNEQQEFIFDMTLNDNTETPPVDNMTDVSQLGELDDLWMPEPTNYQFPCNQVQQQGGEGVLNPNFASSSSSFDVAMDTPLNGCDFNSPLNVDGGALNPNFASSSSLFAASMNTPTSQPLNVHDFNSLLNVKEGVLNPNFASSSTSFAAAMNIPTIQPVNVHDFNSLLHVEEGVLNSNSASSPSSFSAAMNTSPSQPLNGCDFNSPLNVEEVDLNPNFASSSSSFAAAMDTSTSQPLNIGDFNTPLNVLDFEIEPSLAQLEEFQDLFTDLDDNSESPSSEYHPILDENTNEIQSNNVNLNSCGGVSFPTENADFDNQVWEDFMDRFVNN